MPDVDVAFYGDLFLGGGAGGVKGADGGGEGGGGANADDATMGVVDKTDTALVLAAAGEVLTESELSATDEAPPKGFPGLPGPLLRVIAALDRRFGAYAGALFVGELRQVRRYLLEPELKQAAEARVRAAVGGGCRVLIGHSLGSVVALEYLRLHPDRQVDLFVTLGSPLGLRAIRHLLAEPDFGTGEAGPGNVGRWVNLRDRRDPVACTGRLDGWWPMVEDGEVDNGRSPHAAERYLSKRQTGDAVIAAVPELSTA